MVSLSFPRAMHVRRTLAAYVGCSDGKLRHTENQGAYCRRAVSFAPCRPPLYKQRAVLLRAARLLGPVNRVCQRDSDPSSPPSAPSQKNSSFGRVLAQIITHAARGAGITTVDVSGVKGTLAAEVIGRWRSRCAN